MAKYDHGGGCACGLNKVCTCGTGQMDGPVLPLHIVPDPITGQSDVRGPFPDVEIADWDHLKDKLKGETIPSPTATISYRYGEDVYIQEMKTYIDSTYNQHYSKTQFQSTEFIFDAGHGVGFCVGNIMKYAQRYGRKGDVKEWRKDVQKIIHYAIMLLHVHDEEHNEDK